MPENDQIEKMARLLSNEADASALEIGMANPADLMPYDKLPAEMKAVYRKMAERVLARLAYDAATGTIIVLNRLGKVL